MASKKTAKKTATKKPSAPKARPVKCQDVKAFVRAAKTGKLPKKLSADFAFGTETVTVTAKGPSKPKAPSTNYVPGTGGSIVPLRSKYLHPGVAKSVKTKGGGNSALCGRKGIRRQRAPR